MLVDTHGPIEQLDHDAGGRRIRAEVARATTRGAPARGPMRPARNSAVLVRSRPCDAARNSSMRSAHHLSGRFSSRAQYASDDVLGI